MSTDGSQAEDTRRPSQTPSLLKLFYRHGSLHRPAEFIDDQLPEHALVYVGLDCTLDELALELAAAKPRALPSPASGTRLVFQLIFPDLRSTSTDPDAAPRFAVKDLGSVVVGKDGSSIDAPRDKHGRPSTLTDDGRVKLSDASFVVGDYVSVAILQPLADGAVAPASMAYRNAWAASGTSTGGRGQGSRGRGGGGSGGRGGVWRGSNHESSGYFPAGDWRRGQHVPTGPRASRPGPRW